MKFSFPHFAVLILIVMFTSTSLSQGNLWYKISDIPPGVTQYKLRADLIGPNLFVVAADGSGLFKSTDDGVTWVSLGLFGVPLKDFLDAAGKYFVLGLDGVYIRNAGGGAWQKFNSGLEGITLITMEQARTPLGDIELFVGTAGQGVYTSLDSGKTWSPHGTGLENKTIKYISRMLNDIQTESIGLYAVTQEEGVWKINFATNTWEPINNGNNNLTGTTKLTSDYQGNLFIATSTDVRSSLEEDPINWQLETILELANDVVATREGKVYASSYGYGVKQRISAGVWNDFSTGLPVDPDGYKDIVNLYVHVPFQLDLLKNMHTKTTEQYLWAAYMPLHPSMTPGIYRTINPVTDVEDNATVTPEDFELSQNYPNPFNPSTIISYSVPNSSFVTIKIYDVLGNEIAELVNEEKPVGVHEVTFDASNFSTGTYFYQLQAANALSNSGENFVETKKMILIK